jgi:hypothetical protein
LGLRAWLALICTSYLGRKIRGDWADRHTSNHIPNRSDADEEFCIRPVGAIVADVSIQTHEAIEGLSTSIAQWDAAGCTVISLFLVDLNMATTIALWEDARHDW